MIPNQKGQLLIIASIFLSVIFIIAFSLGLAVTHSGSTIKKTNYEKKSTNVADAGIQKAITSLNSGSSYNGETNTAFGDGQFTTSVTSINSTTKQIDAIAYIPNAANPIITKHLRTNATIDATTISFTYGVQIGEGGITMGNNSSITGSVYSNGNITGGTNTPISGDAYVAAGVDSSPDQSHEVCAGSTPPGTCLNYDIGYQVGSEKRYDIAQKFKPASNKKLVKISLYIKKSSASTPSDATIKIVEDNAEAPTGTVVATGTLSGSSTGTTYAWIDVGFAANPSIQDSKYYWILFDSSGGYTSGNHFIWSYDNNSGGIYAQGKGIYSENYSTKPINNINGNASGDLAFKIWTGSGSTKIDSVEVGGHAHANTISNSKVCGDAYYATIDASSLNFLNAPTSPTCTAPLTNGTAHPGSADPAPQAMPISIANITDWENDALTGGTVTCSSGIYTPANGVPLGPKKIPCDFVITGGNTLTITGPLWVAGNITIGNNAAIVLSPGFGGLSTTVIADDPANITTKGIITVNQGVHICGSAGYNSGTNQCNASNSSYTMFLSTHDNTATDGIILENNSDGAIYYTSQSKIEIKNNAKAKQITGWGVELDNNANVAYEIGLSTAAFSAGPGASWAVAPGSWSEIP